METFLSKLNGWLPLANDRLYDNLNEMTQAWLGEWFYLRTICHTKHKFSTLLQTDKILFLILRVLTLCLREKNWTLVLLAPYITLPCVSCLTLEMAQDHWRSPQAWRDSQGLRGFSLTIRSVAICVECVGLFTTTQVNAPASVCWLTCHITVCRNNCESLADFFSEELELWFP